MLFITDTCDNIHISGSRLRDVSLKFSDITSMEAMRLMVTGDWHPSFRQEAVQTMASIALGYNLEGRTDDVHMSPGDKVIMAHIEDPPLGLGFILVEIVP